MKKRYVVLSMVWVIFALILSINNLATVKVKDFAYKDIRKEYNRVNIAILLEGKWREENSNLSITENPYSLRFLIWGNLSDTCLAKLNYLLLKNNNSNILDVSPRTSSFEDLSANRKELIGTTFFLENIFLEEYKSHNISFQVDIVCNGKVVNSIEEKNLIFYTNYYEDNLSFFDQVLAKIERSLDEAQGEVVVLF